MSRFLFPRWTNQLRTLAAVLGAVATAYIVVLVALGASPAATDVGYEPAQPVPYSHTLHAGELGIDCRYCHDTVERAGTAAIPPTGTCINCHQRVRVDSIALVPVRESYATGLPVAWIRVHDLPDYAFFDHSAHVRRGVGCVSCHGRVDRMEVVYQAEPLSMGWCLDCHRDPAPHLRPVEHVTDMGWFPNEDPRSLGLSLVERSNIQPPQDCASCHR